MEDEDKLSSIQYAINLIAACHNENILFEVSTHLAEAFAGNDAVLEFLSERSCNRLAELKTLATEPTTIVRRISKVADA
jgi:hypothetical protein